MKQQPKNRIEMRGVTKSFYETRALDNVDFACCSGEVHALVGLNGAGKSTLMKILGGVYSADDGEISHNGVSVHIDSPARATETGISMIHQEYSLINELTVFANIFLGRELRRWGPFLDKARMASEVSEQLARFGLTIDPHCPVRDLDSGEKQIVEIIRALMSDSWLIVMDEPTSALSEEDKGRLFEFIARMKAEGISIIYISHHMPEIFGVADRVTVMRDGKIVLDKRTSSANESEVIRAMTGQELEGFVKPPKTLSDDVLLAADSLTKSDIFEDVNFEVRRGEIVVLTGLRGCGAPEIAKAIFGLDGDYSGVLTYRGEELVPGRGPSRAVREGMGLVTENRDKNGILAPLSVRDNIALPFLQKNLKFGLIDSVSIQVLVDAAIRRTSTKASSPAQEIRFLSGGNKQKICFSRWLDEGLELLILLEPTRGIDVHAKADIYRIIEGLSSNGVGILVLSYEVDEATLLADKIMTMYHGSEVNSYVYPDFDKACILADIAGASDTKPQARLP